MVVVGLVVVAVVALGPEVDGTGLWPGVVVLFTAVGAAGPFAWAVDLGEVLAWRALLVRLARFADDEASGLFTTVLVGVVCGCQ
jgi:hypothetical protein